MDDIEFLDAIELPCPVCGSHDTERNDEGFLICKECGYHEVEEEEIVKCSRCQTPTPEPMLTNGLCPICADDMGL